MRIAVAPECIGISRCAHYARKTAQAGRWYAVPKKPSDADASNPAREVVDLARMSKLAAQVNRGDLLWATLQPCGAGCKPARVNSISSGAMFLRATQSGAETLNGLTQNSSALQPGHFDVVLKNYLSAPSKAENAVLATSCLPWAITPRINQGAIQRSAPGKVGHRVGMRSGSVPAPGCQTIPTEEKWWASFTTSGQPEWLTRAGVTDASPRWTSYWAGQSERPVYRPVDSRKQRKVKRQAADVVEPTAATDAAGRASAIEPTAVASARDPAPLLPHACGTPSSGAPPPPPPPRPPACASALPSPPPPPFPPPPTAASSSSAHPGEPQETEGPRPVKNKREDRRMRHVLQQRSFRVWVANSVEVACRINRRYNDVTCTYLRRCCSYRFEVLDRIT